MRRQGGDPGGPAVTVCLGHRCAALWRLREGAQQLGALRAAVRGTRGGVLVTTGCLGPCAHGAVVSVGWREADARTLAAAVLLTEADTGERPTALADLVAAARTEPELVRFARALRATGERAGSPPV